MNWTQRTFIIVIVLLYVVIAGALVYFAYSLSPPTTADQYKEFAVRAGIALTATSAFVGVIVSFFTLSAQIRAARDLEVLKAPFPATMTF